MSWKFNKKEDTFFSPCSMTNEKDEKEEKEERTSEESVSWGTVSREALKYLKKHDTKCPNFVPMISDRSKHPNKDKTTLYYGEWLHRLTRYAFDKLKQDNSLNITRLFDTLYNNNSKKITKEKGKEKGKEKEIVNESKTKFGVMNESEAKAFADKLNGYIKDLKTQQNQSIESLRYELKNYVYSGLKSVTESVESVTAELERIEKKMELYNNPCYENDTNEEELKEREKQLEKEREERHKKEEEEEKKKLKEQQEQLRQQQEQQQLQQQLQVSNTNTNTNTNANWLQRLLRPTANTTTNGTNAATTTNGTEQNYKQLFDKLSSFGVDRQPQTPHVNYRDFLAPPATTPQTPATTTPQTPATTPATTPQTPATTPQTPATTTPQTPATTTTPQTHQIRDESGIIGDLSITANILDKPHDKCCTINIINNPIQQAPQQPPPPPKPKPKPKPKQPRRTMKRHFTCFGDSRNENFGDDYSRSFFDDLTISCPKNK